MQSNQPKKRLIGEKEKSKEVEFFTALNPRKVESTLTPSNDGLELIISDSVCEYLPLPEIVQTLPVLYWNSDQKRNVKIFSTIYSAVEVLNHILPQIQDNSRVLVRHGDFGFRYKKINSIEHFLIYIPEPLVPYSHQALLMLLKSDYR